MFRKKETIYSKNNLKRHVHYLKGRKALISGGASGTGRCIAAKLIQEEVAAAAADINLTGEMPPALQAYTCNVAAGTGIDLLFAGTKINPGAPDILICSAGCGIHKKLIKGDPAGWQQVRQATLKDKLRPAGALEAAPQRF